MPRWHQHPASGAWLTTVYLHFTSRMSDWPLSSALLGAVILTITNLAWGCLILNNYYPKCLHWIHSGFMYLNKIKVNDLTHEINEHVLFFKNSPCLSYCDAQTVRPLTFLNDVIIIITFALLVKCFLYLKIRVLFQISGGVFNRLQVCCHQR